MNKRLLFGLGVLAVLLPVLAVGTAVQLENRDTFCGACHTEPESTFLARKAGPASDLASAHALTAEAVRCIDCHSGRGYSGRAESLLQGARDLAAYASGEYDQPAVTQNPVGDGGCTKCHAPYDPVSDPALEINSRSHFHENSYIDAWNERRRNPAGTCAVCHVAHWAGGQAATGFRSNLFVQESCEDCHNSLAGWLPP